MKYLIKLITRKLGKQAGYFTLAIITLITLVITITLFIILLKADSTVGAIIAWCLTPVILGLVVFFRVFMEVAEES